MKLFRAILVYLALCVPALAQTDNLSLNGKFTLTTGPFTATGLVKNSDLANPATTVAGQTCTLGSTCGLGKFETILGGDVAMNNTANYFDGPSVAQGTTGTWYASGGVTITGNLNDQIICKLWDGTTIRDSAPFLQTAGSLSKQAKISLSGIFTTPAANIRISCRDITSTSGVIAQSDGLNAFASSIRVFQIQ